MKIFDTGLRECIYDMVCGNYALELNPLPEYPAVKNEFEEGSACAEGYSRMLEAYSRLCDRLGVEEWSDVDVEVIINELLAIGRHVSLKMFDYGTIYGKKEAE